MNLSLLNTLMLIALVGAAIPIIIEWLFRRRRRRIPFAAMRYLMNPKKRRKIRLQDRILLVLRTVLLAVLAVALARPILRPAEAATAARAARRAVIVLDGTYSMGRRVGQTTAFELGRTMAQDVLRGLPKDASAAFVFLGHAPKVVKPWTADLAAVHDAVSQTRLSDGAGRMPDAIESVARLIADAPGPSPEVYLVSDLQRLTWAATDEDPRDGPAMLADLRRSAEVFVLDTGAGLRSNAYLTRFEPLEKVMAVGVEARFEVDVEVKNMPLDATLLLTLFENAEWGMRNAEPFSRDPQGSAAATRPGARPTERKIETRELPVRDFVQGRLTTTFRYTFLESGKACRE